MLSLFLSDGHGVQKQDILGTSYKMLTPIIQNSLKSAKNLEVGPEEMSEATSNLLSNVWERVCSAISQMFTPRLPSGSQELSILHPTDVVDIVNASAENAPASYSSEFCAVFFTGASKCLKIATTDGISTDDIGNFLNLFAACFSGMCKVKRRDRSVFEIAHEVLNSALQSLETAPTDIDLNVRSALKICEVLQASTDVEVVIIAVFSELSRLVTVEERSMRRAAGEVLARSNIRGVLEDTQSRCNAAEERARIAEDRVLELEKQVLELRREIKTEVLLLDESNVYF